MKRSCCVCGKQGDLRPYGPNGKDICFPCMKSSPELEKTAEAALGRALAANEPLLLDPSEQVGPRLLKSRGSA